MEVEVWHVHWGFLQSLDGDTLSVIENPVAVSHPFHSEKTAGVAGAKGVQGWLKGFQSTTQGKLQQCTARWASDIRLQ